MPIYWTQAQLFATDSRLSGRPAAICQTRASPTSPQIGGTRTALWRAAFARTRGGICDSGSPDCRAYGGLQPKS